jgi:inhibitor of growth protein 3
VGCDGTGCKTEWFHYACVGLAAAPEGDWYCRDCREKRRRSLQKLKDYKRRR